MADKEESVFSCGCEACQMMDEYVGIIVDAYEDMIQIIEDKKLAFPDSSDEFERVLIILRPMKGVLDNVFKNSPGTMVVASSAASALLDIVKSMKQINITMSCVENAMASGIAVPIMPGIPGMPGMPGMEGGAFEIDGETKDKIVELIEEEIQKKKGGNTFH